MKIKIKEALEAEKLRPIAVSVNREYEVYGVSVFLNEAYFLVINDVSIPVWLPQENFYLIENELPTDWVVNLFDENPNFVMGPEFLSKDIESYEKMVELESPTVEEFWEYIKKVELLS